MVLLTYLIMALHVQIFFSDLDVGPRIFYDNVLMETFKISFESAQNKQQYGIKLLAQRYG